MIQYIKTLAKFRIAESALSRPQITPETWAAHTERQRPQKTAALYEHGLSLFRGEINNGKGGAVDFTRVQLSHVRFSGLNQAKCSCKAEFVKSMELRLILSHNRTRICCWESRKNDFVFPVNIPIYRYAVRFSPIPWLIWD